MGTFPAGTPISQTFRPSPHLQAERITTYELGYRAELRPLNASLDARVFLEQARDLIEMNLEPSTIGLLRRSNNRYFANSGEADIRGLRNRPPPGAPPTPGCSSATPSCASTPTQRRRRRPPRPSGWVENTAPPHSTASSAPGGLRPRWQISAAKHWIGSDGWYQDADHRCRCTASSTSASPTACRPPWPGANLAITASNIDGPETFAPRHVGVGQPHLRLAVPRL